MRILALLVKEALQHTGAVIGSTIMLCALWVLALSFTLSSQGNTLLTAATGMVYYGMPLAVGFVLRRLVVLEYEQHTHDFLAALPVSAVVHTALKYALGLAWIWGMGIGAVLLTALVASRQELISAPFLVAVIVQVMAYLFAWYGLTFTAAHLGRYRFTFWMVAIAAMLSLDQLNPDAWQEVLWHSALAESLDVTRGNFPWSSVALSLAWGMAGTVIGFGLGIWEQGAVVASWFKPMSTWEKTVLVMVVVVSWLSVDVVEEFYERGGPAYSRLPDVAQADTVVVRVGTASQRLTPIGERLGEQLVAVGQMMDDAHWPTMVLVPVLDDAEQRVGVRSREHDELVLELDLEQTDHELLIGCLTIALDDRNSELAHTRPRQAWVAAGFARWWLGPDPERPQLDELRAAYAAHVGIDLESLGDSVALRQRLGPDVFRSVGWLGLAALEQSAGREAALELVRRVLARRNRANVVGAVLVDRIDVDALLGPGFSQAWHTRIAAAGTTHHQQVAAFAPRWGELRRVAGAEADVLIESLWVGPIPEGTRVSWHTVDALHTRPIWGDGVGDDERDLVRPIQRIPTPVDARRAIAATYRVHLDAVDGELWSGLVVMP